MTDVRPFWMLGAMYASGYGLLVLIVRRSYPRHLSQMLLYFGIAHLCLGTGYLLLFERDWVGQFPFYVLSDTLMMACMSLEYRTVCVLKQRKPSTGWLFGPPVLIFALCSWFTLVERNISVKFFLVNLTIMTMTFFLGWSLWRNEGEPRPFADSLAAVTYGFLGAATCLVLVDQLRLWSFIPEYDFNSPRAILFHAAAIVTEGVVFPLYLLMLSERLNRGLVVQAMRDPLTGLYNRRAFEEIAFREVSGIARSGQALSVLMIDIDYFKQVNDRHDHSAGDAVLSAVSETLRLSLRDEDFLGRWGGDEFCALLPRARREQAEGVAERARQAIESFDFEIEGKPMKLTISVGIATDTDAERDFASLVKLADAALYRAKNAGRNRFASASDKAPE